MMRSLRAAACLLSLSFVLAIGLGLICVLQASAAERFSLKAFGSPTKVGTGSLAIANADLNGDGKQDVATVDSLTKSISILMGSGTGSFTASKIFLPDPPISLVAVDLNADTRIDLAVGTSTGGLHILLGNGNGTFAVQPQIVVGGVLGSIAVGDFNEDARVDIATANGPSNTVTILAGNNTGSFATLATVEAGPYAESIAVADLTGDRHLDLAITNSSANTVNVMTGNGLGGFPTKLTLEVGADPESIVIGRLDKDQHLDIATANPGSESISVVLGKGSGTFRKAVNYLIDGEPESIQLGNFTKDNRPDLLVTLTAGNKVTIRTPTESGILEDGPSLPAGRYPQASATADFNGDQKADIAVLNGFTGDVTLLLHQGTLKPLVVSETKISSSAFTVKQAGSVSLRYRLSESGSTYVMIERILKIKRSELDAQLDTPFSEFPPGTKCIGKGKQCQVWITNFIIGPIMQNRGLRRATFRKYAKDFLTKIKDSAGRYRASVILTDKVLNRSKTKYVYFKILP